MKRQKTIWLILLSGAMMLSCFYAISFFSLTGLGGRPFPMTTAAGVLAASALITRVLGYGGVRRIYLIFFHSAGFLLALAWLFSRYYQITAFLFSGPWVQDLALLHHVVMNWFVSILLILFAGVLWRSGIRLVTRPPDATEISHRFDVGLACLFFLLLVRLMASVKGWQDPHPGFAAGPMAAFLIFGFLAMGLVRTAFDSDASGSSAMYSTVIRAGTVLSAVLILLAVGAGVFLLFLPELQTVADAGAAMLKAAGLSVEDELKWLLRFLLLGGCRPNFQAPAPAGPPPATPNIPPVEEVGMWGVYLARAVFGLLLAVFAVVLGFFVYRICQWLLQKTSGKTPEPVSWNPLLFFLQVLARIRQFFQWLMLGLSSQPARSAYERLVIWGSRKGISHFRAETPREYGLRLAGRFPHVKREIMGIVGLHENVFYGGAALSGPEIAGIREDLKKIRRPALRRRLSLMGAFAWLLKGFWG